MGKLQPLPIDGFGRPYGLQSMQTELLGQTKILVRYVIAETVRTEGDHHDIFTRHEDILDLETVENVTDYWFMIHNDDIQSFEEVYYFLNDYEVIEHKEERL